MPRKIVGTLFDGPWDQVALRLFDRTPATICHASGAILFASKAFRRIAGREDVIGLDYAALAPASCPPPFFEEVRAAIADAGTWEGEIEMQAPGGSLHWLDTAISDLPGRPGLYLVVHVDMTAARRLRDSEDFHHNIGRISPDGFFVNDGEKTISVNAAGVRMLRGQGPEDIIGLTPAQIFRADCLPAVESQIERQMREPGLLTPMIEATMIAVDGGEVPVEVRAISYPLDGRLVTFAACRDLTAYKESERRLRDELAWRTRAEDELREKTAVLEAAFESSIDGIIMTDLEGGRLLSNRRLAEILRMPPELVADPSQQLPYLASLTANPQALLDHVYWLYDHPDLTSREEIELNDGTILDRVSTPVRDAAGRNYGRVWMFRDITEGRRAQDRISHLARFDSLTGLANRYNLQEHMERLLHRPDGGFALLSMDLDGFKHINDTKGHSVGDALLRRVADRLRAACDRPGMFIARPGGDEFICLVPGADAADALALAQSLVRTLAEPYQLDANRWFMSGASIGVVIAPEHGSSVEELLSRADIALYSAKGAGKGIACLFEHEMESRVQAHVDLEADLRAAMDGDEGLFVFYQPIVDAASEQVTAREALVRWHHGTRGWVSPAEFVPVAEASGLIDRLGAFVLDRACRDAVQWADQARVAVNVSAVQLGKGLLAPAIRTALAASGLAPNRLEIEVTETALLGEEGAVIHDLREARDIGARVVLDDFGTGYSSLSHLRIFPFDKIKIDGSFVRDAVKRPDCAAVVRAVADLGRRLGVTTVAEGVETPAQLECIRAVGCTEIQGYVYARPAPTAGDAARVAALNDEPVPMPEPSR
ncbi:sensor domain-containing protein [Sphingomonas quercus]|uniref:EAL domain-containing protein n=1 Tax=Sphingomonas quercus TaxID=2842451 RepID=A0ABS6BJ40_9SPHN|nr:EAL domain-containing protein [Sphingomonas quercus]MBU3078333.1 EAL domain-containing protein [Sphingomonas quercus]